MADTVYALSAVDKSGRVADRSILRVLGWVPGTRLDIREHAGIIVASATTMVSTASVIVVICICRWRCVGGAAWRPGTASCSPPTVAVVLVAHPLAVLDRLLAGVHVAMAGGEAP
ncbi:hypothetical protein [Micromonospora sp. NPDC050200]|uniref:hypothetical protein n=1 Tax=Micromonospora sp. NPDC050200 TaxID=3155664 RepID=UPI0033CCF288